MVDNGIQSGISGHESRRFDCAGDSGFLAESGVILFVYEKI